MARVLVDLRKHQLSREENGVIFEVHASDEGGKLGDLVVSKGGLRWYPRSSRHPSKLTWKQFDELAQAHGRIEKG